MSMVLGAASQAVATGHLNFHGPIALIHISKWKVPNSISVVPGLTATTYELGARPNIRKLLSTVNNGYFTRISHQILIW